jgi:hypothetical protein
LALLLAADINVWIFRNGIYRSVAAWGHGSAAPVEARRWALVSLALWTAMVFAGRAIAFF